MSRPWKNELRLELRTNGCFAELRRVGWSRRVLASASASGRGAAAITAAIGALRMTDIELMTADARLIVADEYVDFALLNAEVSGAASRQHAADHFAAALGHSDLLVQAAPLPGARGWLAAAIDQSDYLAWTEALLQAGIHLRHVHPALIEDLRTLADRVKEDDAILALLREEGATLLRLVDGVPSTVAWERFDPNNHVALENRLRSFARQTGSREGSPTVIYMLPQSKALCRFVWDGREVPQPVATSHAPSPAQMRRQLPLRPDSAQAGVAMPDNPARSEVDGASRMPRPSGRTTQHQNVEGALA